MTNTEPTPTSTYRYLDGDGQVIYVGITTRGPHRQATHSQTAEWWPYATTQHLEHFPDRPAALRREKELIQLHRPPFNSQHNPGWEPIRAAYLERVSATAVRCGHCEGCQLDAAEPNSEDPYGCRWHHVIAPDEEAITCAVCGSTTCVFADGDYQGGVAGWQSGFEQGLRADRHVFGAAHLGSSGGH